MTVECRCQGPKFGRGPKANCSDPLPLFHGVSVVYEGLPVGEASGLPEAIGYCGRRARDWPPGWWALSFATLDGEWVTLLRHSGRTREGWRVLVGGKDT